MIYTLYLALYAIGRFAVSFAREDKVWTAGLQEAHFIALVVLAITIPLLAWKARFVPNEHGGQELTELIQARGTRAQRRRRGRGR